MCAGRGAEEGISWWLASYDRACVLSLSCFTHGRRDICVLLVERQPEGVAPKQLQGLQEFPELQKLCLTGRKDCPQKGVDRVSAWVEAVIEAEDLGAGKWPKPEANAPAA
eukprot:SAG22_NODE_16181_length_331_cov_0.849138_1_plen_109_part_11